MNSSIRWKVFGAVALMLGVVLLVAGVSRRAQDRSRDTLDEVLSNQVPSALALGRISSAVLRTQLWTRHGLIDLAAQDRERIVGDRHERDSALASLEEAMTTYGSLPMRRGEASLWRDCVARITRFRSANDGIWSALSQSDLPLARERVTESQQLNRETADACGHSLDYQSTLAEDARNEARQTSQSASMLLGLAMLAAFVALLGAGGGLAATLVSRTTRLRAASERIARGEFDVTLVPQGGGDEIDALERSLQAIVEMLRSFGDATNAVAAGDVDRTVAPHGPNDQLAASMNRMIATLRDAARQANVIAAGDYDADIAPRGDRDALGLALQKMTGALRKAADESRDADWLKTGVAQVNDLVLGQEDPRTLANVALTAIATHLDAKVGVLYALESDAEGPALRLLGSYAYTERKHVATRFRVGEGLVGQAALEKKSIVLSPAPEDYVHVVSGLGTAPPRALSVVPILFKDELRGVIELGTFGQPTAVQQQYLAQVATVLGAAFEITRGRSIVAAQQEELRAYTTELEGQRAALQASEHELKAQQAELESSNAELEVQMRRTQESEVQLKAQQRELEITNRTLEDRNVELERQKAAIEVARRDLAVQADELAVASKYKSEFLANMSHELRTPLNSMLLLARSLRDAPEHELNADQRESAGVIYASGSDLLNLINEILDLSKIEAGRMELRLDATPVSDLARALQRQFEPMARSQGLTLEMRVAPDMPAQLVTDPNRLGQVLKNLVGNAMKFTDKGGVVVSFERAAADADLSRSGLATGNAVAVRITDTGIGIPLNKQKIVFEAFQQADSGDRRRYGGTGLGLSISREIVALLGGEIQLTSTPGQGSTFTVFLPVETHATQHPSAAPFTAGAMASLHPAPQPLPTLSASLATTGTGPASVLPPAPVPSSTRALSASVPDDRDVIDERDRTILIIEDDARFLGVLVGEVRNRGFKCLAALTGGDGLALAKMYRPSGVLLDLHLPDTTGWAVLSALKQDVETRHVPVHIVSAEDATLEGLRIGAIGHAHKPLRPEDVDRILATIERSSATAEKTVLVVEDDPIVRRETVRIIGNGNVHSREAATGREALAALQEREFDLMVLDLGLPDMQGLEILEAAAARKLRVPPVIVYTVRELTQSEELALRHYADSIIVKDVRSQERLIDEVALFLHRVVDDLPESKRQTIRHLYESDEQLRGKRVLIVEDDMRTMFAMAKLLAGHGIDPLKAADGEQALKLLGERDDVDLVLLDMMMPVLDGYETARRIRAQERFTKLPVIALTAKAMKEDRQKCIDAGATDYLSKPVDQDRLLSLLRVWLCR